MRGRCALLSLLTVTPIAVPDRDAPAQTPPPAEVPEIRLRIDPAAGTAAVRIELDLERPDTVHLLFDIEWEAYPGLPERFAEIEAWGPGGVLPVSTEVTDPGPRRHRVAPDVPGRVTIEYSVTLTPEAGARFYHRASQLSPAGGHLIAGDLLPRVSIGTLRQRGRFAARLWFSGLPADWRVVTNERRSGTGYAVDDIAGAIFVLGPLRSQRFNIGPRALTAVVYGRWPVADDRLIDATRRIAGTLHRIAGEGWRGGDHLVALGRAPVEFAGLTVGGQVTGSTGLVFVSGNAPPELEFEAWLQTTAHELMHWYIPNGFRFGIEPPAWFAEGFTDYMALKALLAAGLMEPRAFLDKLSTRLKRYRDSALYDRRSLPSAEDDFWEDESYRYIYDGGASAAFLLDLGFQDRGGSLERALRQLRGMAPLTVESLVSALTAVPENAWLGEWLASGANPDWQARLDAYGLAWRRDSLVRQDDWAIDALSSIRP